MKTNARMRGSKDCEKEEQEEYKEEDDMMGVEEEEMEEEFILKSVRLSW